MLLNLDLLKKNQLDALNISIDNDFLSGIHYHATGSGKSWIAMYILAAFYQKYPEANVLWICERKDILIQQFSKKTLKQRGFNTVLKNYNVLDFVQLKTDKWYESLNASAFWGKPFLCIINRCFLTSQKKYKFIKKPIDLVIHDECHSIENNTTQEFYQWLEQINLSKFKISTRIIGFSATPEIIAPLNQIISKYSIYDGFLDQVILPPKIVWLKSEKKPSIEHLITLLQTEIQKLPYQKIIVWCGMIEECIKTANRWEAYFQDFELCLDFNNMETHQKANNCNFKNFDHFYQSNGKSILFCAVKHREGSDIPNVDGCIFMDLVERRGERVFIQCMGRVLRKDSENKKTYGLVVDLRARSTIEVCNRIQHYLKLEDIFPWEYSIQQIKLDSNSYYLNQLNMIDGSKNKSELEVQFNKKYTSQDIYKLFVRPIPEQKEYKKRLDYEIELILSKDLFGNMVRALEILKITKSIPHITRGSCGSSLVCYLLGISHVDPVKYEITFARFINQYRNTLPDIDFDFPHYLRDEVFLKLFQKYGNKVARISNHNYYHEKSALRQALRDNGINKFISKYDLQNEIKSLDKCLQKKIKQTQKELEGTFRGFSLHCGGIIYFPQGVPSDLILEGSNKSILKQVTFNKQDVSENKNFKIDILSSRGLTQLYHCYGFQDIDFNQHIGDPKTIELLSSGDNIGITLAETPLMRKALLLIKPKTLMDVAICLSIIRPAAKDARKEFETGNYVKDNLIFDDDVITILSKLVGCNQEMADKLRRGYCKGDSECLKIVEGYIKTKHPSTQKRIKNILENLRKYGFCKAHALSYAQLVWQLAYQKAHYPKKFWKATLKNIDTCYRNWVHIYEARCHGVTIGEKQDRQSIYAMQRSKNLEKITSPLKQLQTYGYWNMESDEFYDDCYYYKNPKNIAFQGLIASSRMLNYGKNKKIVLFVGVAKHKYIEILVTGNFYFDSRKVLIKGHGVQQDNIYKLIECKAENITFI